ncbi:MAG: hypothetical protein Q8N51_02210, partial [Gammaproteobacteria bacterium]|nr:hypothetical protein [Gammaproteobacteria bacterium]
VLTLAAMPAVYQKSPIKIPTRSKHREVPGATLFTDTKAASAALGRAINAATDHPISTRQS